uniref:ISXO2-like transposase domain-containing protein n=1 Tax=Octopus bimaculoides TaxID=37653 RepID=A0A0L8IIR3_OCTBM
MSIKMHYLRSHLLHTDKWASYRNLQKLGYIHKTVNHSTNFVDPETGACTNHIEVYWSRIKRRLKYVTGSSGDMKWSRVDESMYREMYGFGAKKNFENFYTFLEHIAKVYPPKLHQHGFPGQTSRQNSYISEI